jgi:hypothetical protein
MKLFNKPKYYIKLGNSKEIKVCKEQYIMVKNLLNVNSNQDGSWEHGNMSGRIK